MPLIKRYPNRKLYDTEDKKYITLEGIATLIRQGKDIQVVDYTSGEDLTAVTLTQIIFEQEKKSSGFLPKNVLTGLVQAGGDTMSTLRRTLASPLDLAHHVDEEIERRLQSLISRGELAAEEGHKVREQLVGKYPSGDAQLAQDRVERALNERGVPSQEDLHKVLEQLDLLAHKINEIATESETS